MRARSSFERAPADERLCDAPRADQRLADGRRFPAAVSVHRRVGGEHRDQRIRIARLPGLDVAPRDLLALGAGDLETPPPLVDVRMRAGEDLTRVRGRLADDARDVLVRLVEDLAEQEDRPLDR